MSKEIVATKAQTQEVATGFKANQSFNDFIANESTANIEALINQDLKVMIAGINTAVQYLELEQGEAKRFVFMGIVPDYRCMSNDGVMIELEAAILVDNKKDFYAYAAIQCVSTIVARGFAIGSGIEICWVKQKKTKNGNMRVHTVKPLKGLE